MGTVIRFLHRYKYLIINIKQVRVSLDTIITSKMMTNIFMFILLVASIGCTFAKDVHHQRRDKMDRIESLEFELGGLGAETNEISKGYEPTQRKDCIPHNRRCNYDSRKCCSGSRCKAHHSGHGWYATVYGCV